MKKKTDLLIIIILTILISIASISLFVNQYGLIKINQQLIRLFLTLILSYFLYLEKQWARWIWVVLFYFTGISGAIGVFSLFKNSILTGGIILSIMSLFYIGSTTYIAFIRKWQK